MKHEKTVVIYYLDLLAYLIKHFALIVVVCFIGMIISIGLHYRSENTSESIEKYNRSVSEYATNLSSLNVQKTNLTNRKNILEKQKSEDPAVLMSDGRSIYEKTIFISVALNDHSSNSSVNIEKTYDTITSTLKAYLNSIDIAGIINSSISNTCLQSIWELDGGEGLYTIKIYTDDQLVPESIAEYFMGSISSFIDSRDEMRLVNISMQSNLYSGPRFIKAVEKYDDEIIELNSKIKEKSDEILSLEKTPVTRYHFIRYSLIGFIIGGFFSILLLVSFLVLRNPITSSFKAERIIEKPFLGFVFKNDGIFDKMSRKMIGERQFKDINEAENYLRNSINNNFSMIPKDSAVVILSTAKEKLVLEPGERLCALLKESGFNVEFLPDSADNPDVLCDLKKADAVLLLEKQWTSKWTLIEYNYNLSERFEKPVIGFVLC